MLMPIQPLGYAAVSSSPSDPGTGSPFRSTTTVTMVPIPASAPSTQTTIVMIRAALLPRRSAMPSTT
jgi:hypothetical protein